MTKTLDINGKITISIDPDSQEFADRVFAALSAMDKQNTDLLKTLRNSPTPDYKVFLDANTTIREQIDDLFGVPVCATLFGENAICALAGGAPLWFNLMEGVIGALSIVPTKECRMIMKKYAAKRR